MYQYLGFDPAESSSMWLESKYKHFSLINHVKIPTAKIVQSRGSESILFCIQVLFQMYVD